MNWKSRTGSVAAKATVAIMAASGLAVAAGPAAGAAIPNEGGPAVVTAAPNGNVPLNSGDQQTAWILKLPAGAKCSQSTAAAGYHVFTYVVPSSVDPNTLTFTADGPNQGFPLYDDGGSPIIGINTAVSPAGAVVPIPFFTMNWAVFDTSLLPPGTYNVGVACANGAGVGDKYWNVQETFTAKPSDPTMFTWAVVPGTPVPEVPLTVLLPLSVVGVLGAGFFVMRRRRSPEALAIG